MDQNVGINASGWEFFFLKKTYYLTLVLERLFKYMFQEDYKVVEKKQKKPRRR
jgi:hypothetical protein